MGEYTHDTLLEIDGVKTTKPDATFYLLADFNAFATDLQKAKISTSQKLSESLMVHPYHTAIVGGDSLVLERTDYSARIAYVDYDGGKVYENYKNQKPKTHSERTEFVVNNAPKTVGGIKMIARFFDDIKHQ
jgi:aspartate aminotransferase